MGLNVLKCHDILRSGQKSVSVSIFCRYLVTAIYFTYCFLNFKLKFERKIFQVKLQLNRHCRDRQRTCELGLFLCLLACLPVFNSVCLSVDIL